MGLISRALFRKAFRGPYIPLGGGRRSTLGNYNRSQINLSERARLGSYARYKNDQDVIDNLADSAEAWFNDSQEKGIFDDLAKEVISALPEISDFNPGQKAIMEEFVDDGIRNATNQGKKFDPERWVSEAKNSLGDEKYNAVSETIENTAALLEELARDIFNNAEWWWAASEAFSPLLSKGPAFTARIRTAAAAAAAEVRFNRTLSSMRHQAISYRRRILFSSPFTNDLTPNRVFGSNLAALQSWRAGAAKRFASDFPELHRKGVAWDSYQGSKARRQDTVKKFFETRGYTKQANGSYLTKTDLAKIRQTTNQVRYWGYRW